MGRRENGLGSRGDSVVVASQKPTKFAPVPGNATGTSGWRTGQDANGKPTSNRSATNKTGAKSGKRLIYSGKPRRARAGDITDGYKPGWMGLSRDGGYGVTTKSRGINKHALKSADAELSAEIKRLRTTGPVESVAPVEIPAPWSAPVNVADVREQYQAAISNARQRESMEDASGAAAWMVKAREFRRIIRSKGE